MKKLASLNDCKFHNKFNDSVTHVIVRPGELFYTSYRPLMMLRSEFIYFYKIYNVFINESHLRKFKLGYKKNTSVR